MPKDPAKPDTAIVDIPLGSGLSQKWDFRLLPLGQSATATNLISSKQGTFQKPAGYTRLGTASEPQGVRPIRIPRIAALSTALAAVGEDSTYGVSCVWTRDEAADTLCLNDRISECYIPPVFGAIGQSTQPVELDTAVYGAAATPYELHVGEWAGGAFYYAVTEPVVSPVTGAAVRSYVVAPSAIPPLSPPAGPFTTPKVILCGSIAVLTAQESASIWMTTLDLTAPRNGWTAAVKLVSNAVNTAPDAYGHPSHGVYDTAAPSDSTSQFLLTYPASGAPNAITLLNFSTGGLQLDSGTLADATWTASGFDLSAIAVRASVAGAQAWVAYAYAAGGSTPIAPVTTVNAGALNYPALNTVVAAPIAGVNGITGGLNAYPQPQHIDIAEVPGTVAGQAHTQQVVWSPITQPLTGVAGATFGAPVFMGANSFNIASGKPCCAIFQAAIYAGGGGSPTTTLHPNQPRWTNNAVLASRMSVVTNDVGTSHAYMVGWTPSYNTIPGSTGISTISVVNPGNYLASSGQITTPLVTVTGGGGTGAEVQLTIDPNTGLVTGALAANPGVGYTGGVINITPTTGTGVTGSNFGAPVQTGGVITSIPIVSAFNQPIGTGFNPAPETVPVVVGNNSSTPGSGAIAWAIVNAAGQITGVTIASGGSGYNTGTLNAGVPVVDAAFLQANVPTVQNQDIQGTFFLFCMDTFADVSAGNSFVEGTNVPMRMCGLWRPRLGKGDMPANNHVLPHLVPAPNGSPTGALLQTDLPIDASAQVAVSTVCAADFGSEYSYQPAELGTLIGFAGALPCVYDGSRTADIAFPYYPENIVATVALTAGANTTQLPSGTYQYIAIYTRRDAAGNIHRSGRSVAATVIVGTVPVQGGVASYGTNPPPVTMTGNPVGDPNTIVITITTGGGINAAKFTWTVNGSGGQTGVTVQNAVSLPGTGVTANFTAGIYSTDNVYVSDVYEASATGVVTLYVPTMGFSTAQRGQPTEDVTIGIPPQPPEYVEIYRTEAGGTNYYAVVPQQPNGQSPITAFPLNSVVAPFITFVDTITDGNLISNPKLYGDGLDGIAPNSNLDNLCPPPLQGMITHKNRWFGFDGTQVWYTKALTDGEGPGFNELFAFSVDDGPGPVTGLASMDERLIIWKRDRIFYVTGDGPADNNTQNDLQPPQRIQSDVGCTNWRSIVTAPSGVWFDSDNGLYQLTRKLEVQPAGKFVEDVTDVYTDITSAVRDLANGYVVFGAQNPTGGEDVPFDSGIQIIYSWVLDTWTLQQPVNGDALIYRNASACLSGPALAYTWTDGLTGIYRRTAGGAAAGSYMVDNVYQSAVWESPWIVGNTRQSWLRINYVTLLWQALDPHALKVEFAYNYSESYSETWTVGATSQAAVVTPWPQWSFWPLNPQCESFRIRVSDVADATVPPVTGAGPMLIACTVEFMDQGGTYKKSNSQRGNGA